MSRVRQKRCRVVQLCQRCALEYQIICELDHRIEEWPKGNTIKVIESSYQEGSHAGMALPRAQSIKGQSMIFFKQLRGHACIIMPLAQVEARRPSFRGPPRM